MERYVGFDVSLKETAICVIDDVGRRVWQGSGLDAGGTRCSAEVSRASRHEGRPRDRTARHLAVA